MDENKKFQITYHEGFFDKYKAESALDRWDDFPEKMWGLGFEMDCEKSFQQFCQTSNLTVKEPHSVREKRKNNLYLLEHAGKQIVGNYLFSHWRYLTHWAMGYDEFEIDYLRRIIEILEKCYQNDQSDKKSYKLTGKENFTHNGVSLELDVQDFWHWHFCDRFDLQDKIAEYIVAKALEKTEADNVGYWTLYDIDYRDKRIEVKETSYYHSWQADEEKKSKARVFGIGMAHEKYKDPESKLARQSDIYVFCLNTGETKADSDPLELTHWEFYIIGTDVINRECGSAKTICLSRLKKLVEPVPFDKIKETVDQLISDLEKSSKTLDA